MLVTLQTKTKMNTLALPEKVKGQYWLTDENEKGAKYNLMEIEGINGTWRLKSNRLAGICSANGAEIDRFRILNHSEIYRIALYHTDEIGFVVTEPDTKDRKVFTKYRINQSKIQIEIGREEGADIRYAMGSVSSVHAVLEYNEGTWSIFDNDSTNGTYVNGIRLNGKKALKYGDTVFIIGLKIIVCNDFLAMNNPDGKVILNHRILIPLEISEIYDVDEDDINIEPVDYYYQSPRFKRDIKEYQMKVDSPPGTFVKDEMPLIMVLGPSITMGIASITTASYSIYNAIQNGNIASAIPSMAMATSMLLGTVLWPILSKKYEKNRNAERERARNEEYSAYLLDVQERIDTEVDLESKIILENNPPTSYWTDIIRSKSRKLWERTKDQNDFLCVRVGIGEQDARITFNYQERKFAMGRDFLQDSMLDICENQPRLKMVPITVSLVEDSVFGIVGIYERTSKFLTNVLVQLAAQYAYNEVKFCFIMNEKQEKEHSYVRRLPHIWTNEHDMRFLATNYTEVKQISNYFDQMIDERINDREGNKILNDIYYIFFVLDKTLADKAEVLKKIYKQEKNINISVVNLCEQLKDLPKECSKFIEIHSKNAKIYDKKDITGQSIEIVPDYYEQNDLDELVLLLADTQLDLSSSAYNLPKLVTFLDMYGVSKIEHLNAEMRWKENNPVKSLETPIGIDTMGELFKLDLHEKFHGPHGLVAGMTGSGKSEFIMAFILSMALNYHPYEVAFVLIDYKGGGMAKAFEKLPHTAGIITNLDGAAVNRSLVSIQSELKRRQAIFSEAGKAIGESNIDIYKYQKIYREGKVKEPLQHLFIISDEFAELKTQQPEFMEQLVSAARIGRSLGVHLILATQKPAGVVDDQIWSNSRFRICLKVQDRADSMDMLKRPDAAALADTGRFYLQVGYNELFELGQSAWAGAPYIPSDRVVKKRDTSVELLDRCGIPLTNMKLEKQQMITNPKKQLDEITEYLAKIAEEEKIKIRPLWLAPIPEKIYIENLRRKYNFAEERFVLNPIIGEYDDPARQRQCLMTLPLSTEGNTLLYGTAGNGKTTFLTAMFYSLMSRHTPSEVVFYILDFSAETLTAFREAPHVGDVLIAGDDDKLENMFKMLSDEIQKRKTICAEFGGDYNAYVRSGHEDLPNIVVTINNYTGFSENYEDYEEYVQYQSREGVKYGIYYVITALSTNAIRYRLQQNFRQMYVLQMNDDGEYATVLGSTGGMVPSRIKGRGLFKTDEIYEFQTAYVTDPFTVSDIRNYCSQLVKVYGKKTTEIPVLPQNVTADMFVGDINLSHLPIGISKEKIEIQYIDVKNPPVSVVAGIRDQELEVYMHGITEEISELDNVEVMILDGSGELDSDDYMCEVVEEDFEEKIIDIYQTVLYRNNHYKEYNGVLPDGEIYEQKVIILYQFSELRKQLSDDGIDKIKVVLDKVAAAYNISFIVCDFANSMYKMSREPWYKHQNPNQNGIYIGNGITSQNALNVDITSVALKKQIEAGFGYVVTDGEAVLTKLITSRMEAVYE